MERGTRTAESRPGGSTRGIKAPGPARRPSGAVVGTRAVPRSAFRVPTSTHAPDYWLIVTLVALVVFGTVMIFSATFAINLPQGGGTFAFLSRQLLWVTIGGIACFLTSRIDYHTWRRYSIPALACSLVALVLVLVPHIGVGSEVGARRWLNLGPLPQFQPSEVAKAALILYIADWLTRRGPRLQNWRTGIIPFAIILGGMIFLVMLEPDLGTSSLLAIIGITMLLVAGADLRQFTAFLGSGALAFVFLALAAPYRRDRLMLFMRPEADLWKMAGGWQLIQARLSFGSGGLVGVGLGASRLKYGWLPAAHTDAIFAVVGEELGLVGCACLLSLFLLLAVRGYRVAFRAPDPFGALLATGIVSWIVFQAMINIGGITTTIPFTGVPLPFVSYGGTSLMVVLAIAGVLVNISRQTVAVVEGGRQRAEGRGQRGRRTVSAGRGARNANPRARPIPLRSEVANHPLSRLSD
jgi:cell division protein FtsW